MIALGKMWRLEDLKWAEVECWGEKKKKTFSQMGKKILTSDLMLECFGILLCSLWGCFVRGHRTRLKITTGRRLARMEKDWGNLAPFLCGPGAAAQLIMSDPECTGSSAHLTLSSIKTNDAKPGWTNSLHRGKPLTMYILPYNVKRTIMKTCS